MFGYKTGYGSGKRAGYIAPGDFEAVPADETAPSAPSGLAANAGDAQVVLSWTDPADSDLVSVRVYRSISSGTGFSLQGSVSAGVESFTDTEVTNDTTYYYRLTAVDEVPNESSATSEVSATPAAASAIYVGSSTSSLTQTNRTQHDYTHNYIAADTYGDTLAVLVFFFGDDGDEVITSVDPKLTVIADPATTDSTGRGWLGYYIPDSTDISGGTLSLSMTTESTEVFQYVVVEVAGVNVSSLVNQAQTDSTGSASSSIGPESFTTVPEGAIIVIGAASDNVAGLTTTITTANSFTEISNLVSSAAGHSHSVAYRIVPSAGNYSGPVFTLSAADGQVSIGVVLNPA